MLWGLSGFLTSLPTYIMECENAILIITKRSACEPCSHGHKISDSIRRHISPHTCNFGDFSSQNQQKKVNCADLIFLYNECTAITFDEHHQTILCLKPIICTNISPKFKCSLKPHLKKQHLTPHQFLPLSSGASTAAAAWRQKSTLTGRILPLNGPFRCRPISHHFGVEEQVSQQRQQRNPPSSSSLFFKIHIF